MRLRLGSLSSCFCVFLLAASASADPFTGRYNFESQPDANGVSISGFIDFVNAPMGTSAFDLDALFITGFSIVASGPLIDTLTWSSLGVAGVSFGLGPMPFDDALGSAILNPEQVLVAEFGRWAGGGDLDGHGDAFDLVDLVSGYGAWYWSAWNDYEVVGGVPVGRFASVYTLHPGPPPWRLVLQAAPVPEPGALALMGLAVVGGAAWRRRNRTS